MFIIQGVLVYVKIYIANFVNFIGKTCYAVKSIEKINNIKISPGHVPRCAMCTLRLCIKVVQHVSTSVRTV